MPGTFHAPFMVSVKTHPPLSITEHEKKTSGTQCSLRVKNVTIRHRVVMLTKNSPTNIRRND